MNQKTINDAIAKFMDWKAHDDGEEGPYCTWDTPHFGSVCTWYFHPLSDMGHLQRVLHKLSEDPKLWGQFTQVIANNKPKGAGIWGRYWILLMEPEVVAGWVAMALTGVGITKGTVRDNPSEED